MWTSRFVHPLLRDFGRNEQRTEPATREERKGLNGPGFGCCEPLTGRGRAPSPVVSTEFILWVHREFCPRLPDDLLWIESPETHERLCVAPGELRKRHVKVGRDTFGHPSRRAAPAPDLFGRQIA